MRSNRQTILTVAGIAMLAVSLPLAVARAQSGAPTGDDSQFGQQGGPPQRGGPPQVGPGGQFGGPTQPGGQFGGPNQPGGQFQRGMAGGGAAIAVDESFVYVLRGNTIFKLKKSDLKVSASGELPLPQPPGAGGDRIGGDSLE